MVGAVGIDPVNTLNHFMIAYGGAAMVTKDGKLNSKDPAVREAAIRAIDKLGTLYKEGYIPRSSVNWNDADDNNAFHSRLCVVDFDGTLSTELAMLQTQRDDLKHVVTHGLPLSNDGQKLPAVFAVTPLVIPKGAKNVAVAKDFARYLSQPEVNNEFLKGGLGRWLPVMREIAKKDAEFWLHAKNSYLPPYVQEGLRGPTIPTWYSYNPAWAEVETEHVFQLAMADIWNGKSSAKQAADNAFARSEQIFAKYPIQTA